MIYNPRPEKPDSSAQTEHEGQEDVIEKRNEDSLLDSVKSDQQQDSSPANPPLPEEIPPPLPNEVIPDQPPDDGWEPVWDDRAQAFYFYNKFTKVSQWENPRVPDASKSRAPGVGNHDRIGDAKEKAPVKRAGGYDPAIHGDYDPNADYAKAYEDSNQAEEDRTLPGVESGENYAATGAFNRFTGKWQSSDLNPEKFSDESKANRQMNAFFDVDLAANSHDGRSLRAERANKKLSKKEVKAFKEKRRERKEEKRRAWLRD